MFIEPLPLCVPSLVGIQGNQASDVTCLHRPLHDPCRPNWNRDGSCQNPTVPFRAFQTTSPSLLLRHLWISASRSNVSASESALRRLHWGIEETEARNGRTGCKINEPPPPIKFLRSPMISVRFVSRGHEIVKSQDCDQLKMTRGTEVHSTR